MADLNKEQESVRSNISDASSGYAFVSAPAKKQRGALENVYPPYEPPPDYDVSSPITDKHEIDTNTSLLVKSSPTTPTRESNQPLLNSGTNNEQPQGQPKTIVRINSSDINIEIFSHAQSPSSINTESAFFPRRPKQGCFTCSKSRKVTCLCVLLLIVVLALVLVIVNFTVCIGDVTSACK